MSNPPKLSVGLELFLNAFAELDTERPIGHSALAPIPRHALKDMAKELGYVAPLDYERFRVIMRELDKVKMNAKPRGIPAKDVPARG